MITTCTKCGQLYESSSEEQAYEAERFCFDCAAARELRRDLGDSRVLRGLLGYLEPRETGGDDGTD